MLVAISELTKDCSREDCRISGGNRPTVVSEDHFGPVYDKRGTRLEPAPSTTSDRFKCATCGQQWLVSKTGDSEVQLLAEFYPDVLRKPD